MPSDLRLKRGRVNLKHAQSADEWLVLRVGWKPSRSGWSGSMAWLKLGSHIFHLGKWSKR